MKKITIEFYSNEDKNNSINSVLNDIKLLFCPDDLINVKEEDIEIETEEINENIMFTNYYYNLPKIIKIVKDDDGNYLFNDRRDYSKGVFDISKKDELKEFSKVMGGKQYTVTSYHLAKIKDKENLYLVVEKENTNEEEFIAAPHDSFTILMRKIVNDRNYMSDSEFMKFTKNIIPKCCKTQKGCQELISFFLDNYLPEIITSDETIFTSIDNYKELIDLVMSYEIAPSLFNASLNSSFSSRFRRYAYSLKSSTDDNNKKRDKEYISNILQHVYRFTEKEKDIILDKADIIGERYELYKAIKDIRVIKDNILTFEELKAISKFVATVSDDFYAYGRESTLYTKIDYTIACEVNLLKAYKEDSTLMDYEDLIKFIADELLGLYIIDNRSRITSIGTFYSYGKFTLNVSCPITFEVNERYPIIDSILLALENIKGRSRNKYRENYLKNELFKADVLNKTEMKTYINDFIDSHNLINTKESIMKVKLKRK